MNEEIKKIINQIEDRLALHEAIKEPISKDLDKAIKLSVAYEELLKENQRLKDNWNKLKQYLLGGIASDNYIITENSMLSKMQEIEKSDK